MVTDKRPLSEAVPETEVSTLPKLAGVTLHCMLDATLEKVRLPVIVSVQLGASVPSTVAVSAEPRLTAPLPPTVPDLYT